MFFGKKKWQHGADDDDAKRSNSSSQKKEKKHIFHDGGVSNYFFLLTYLGTPLSSNLVHGMGKEGAAAGNTMEEKILLGTNACTSNILKPTINVHQLAPFFHLLDILRIRFVYVLCRQLAFPIFLCCTALALVLIKVGYCFVCWVPFSQDVVSKVKTPINSIVCSYLPAPSFPNCDIFWDNFFAPFLFAR